MNGVHVRPLASGDVEWATALADREFGGRLQARRGELVDALALPGFVALDGDERTGLLTFAVRGEQCELVLLAATRRRTGIGRRLVEALVTQARGAGARRVWLVTTNDNLDALAFYQRLGFRLVALRAGAVDESRRTLKPAIGLVGDHGIPLRDELELALDL